MRKISVCIATYNGEKYIYQQLESILKQLGDDDEVVISDDSSMDKTLEIVKGFRDERIKILENNRSCGPVYNFENALKHANGEIIFLSDQDDVWYDNKVKIVSELLNFYNLVVSDCVLIDENGEIINESFFKLRNSGRGFIKNIYKNSYIGCCMAFDRKILDIALPFPENLPMHDMWIGMMGELFGRTYFCNQKLVKYRRHENSASPTSGPSPYTIRDKISFRVNLLLKIIERLLERRTNK
jgi:glycosyltransferase involved in cell wall biosynthesis